MNTEQDRFYEEDALDKYEYTLLLREQMLVLELSKRLFPSLADAVGALIDAARGTGRMELEANDPWDTPFPRMVYFSYDCHIIGEGMLTNIHTELDENLCPIRETFLFDRETIAVHFIPMTYGDFIKQWDAVWSWKELEPATLYHRLCFLPPDFYCSRFYPAGKESRIYHSHRAIRRAMKADALQSMVSQICDGAKALGYTELSAHSHYNICFSEKIKVRQCRCAVEEPAQLENAGQRLAAEDKGLHDGKSLLLGEFDPETGNVILYVHTMLLYCIMADRAIKAHQLETVYPARLFSVLRRTLLCAFRYEGQKEKAKIVLKDI